MLPFRLSTGDYRTLCEQFSPSGRVRNPVGTALPGRRTAYSSAYRKHDGRTDLQLREHSGLIIPQHDAPVDVLLMTIRSGQRPVRFTEGSG
ncbi:hypothetical protein AGR13a_Cc340045 [Agrobacterium genomosp. 13 str. CFBP 6927]|uniref:Uncharacterized protein n=1 Tax=Agrobacterium genomosp. 13 str. CFBP 6927 TaxID=1183428 RepID=A0ABP2BJM5_9HYPH|nr:hypothetical protein AGR13a_Cc340045 [Agrobacterium genomosp. 13 str. CFBP 6927]